MLRSGGHQQCYRYGLEADPLHAPAQFGQNLIAFEHEQQQPRFTYTALDALRPCVAIARDDIYTPRVVEARS